jgi:hypothetical protein
MNAAMIVLAYIVLMFIELPPLIIDKKKREALFFIIFMVMALAESIVIATADELPSVASIIKKILSPLLNIKI